METTCIIRADANTQIGIGHLMRCVALAQTWRRQGGRVTFLSHCKNEAIRQYILGENFGFVHIEAPHPSELDLYTLNETLREASQENGTDATWLILDGYHFTSDYQETVRKAGHRLLVIDDCNHLPYYHADIILNQNINAEELSYSCEPETKLLLGTEYVLIRDEFLAYKNWKREIPEVAKKILVTMGGGDPDNVTLKVLKALNQINVRGLQVRIVLGVSNPHFDNLRKASWVSNHNIELLQNVSNMPEIMAWADIAVSAGGSTCWELTLMGVPIIVIETADNQKGVAKGLDKHGAAINLGWYSEVSLQQIIEKLNMMLVDCLSRKRMCEQGVELVDGKGLNRVISNMLNKTDQFYLCLAKEEDAKLLWQWANDPDLRNNSFNPKHIEWRDHLKWFENKISSDGTRIWILEHNNDPIGQIRYDRINNTTAEVDFSIDPKYRSKGMGTKILILSSVKACRELDVEFLNGIVLGNNNASIKAFIKAGYKSKGEKIVFNKNCHVFSWSYSSTIGKTNAKNN